MIVYQIISPMYRAFVQKKFGKRHFVQRLVQKNSP